MKAKQKTTQWLLAGLLAFTSALMPLPSEAYSRTRKKSQNARVLKFKPLSDSKKTSSASSRKKSSKSEANSSSGFLFGAPIDETNDSITAAGTCIECSRASGARVASPALNLGKVTINEEASVPSETISDDEFGNACLRKKLLESAKTTVAKLFRNRPYSVGKCARGVRASLNNSSVSNVGSMGDAVSWHLGGHLKRQGFKNILKPGLTAENAPPGAILVFRGPGTDMSRANGGLPSKRARRGRSAGYWVGHVTIKGDKPGKYYTDGLTADAAVAGRSLVAIYVPEKCVNCKPEVKMACGG